MRAAAAILSLAGFTLLAVAYSAPCPSAGGTAPWLLGFIMRLTAALACLATALRLIDNTPSKIYPHNHDTRNTDLHRMPPHTAPCRLPAHTLGHSRPRMLRMHRQ